MAFLCHLWSFKNLFSLLQYRIYLHNHMITVIHLNRSRKRFTHSRFLYNKFSIYPNTCNGRAKNKARWKTILDQKKWGIFHKIILLNVCWQMCMHALYFLFFDRHSIEILSKSNAFTIFIQHTTHCDAFTGQKKTVMLSQISQIFTNFGTKEAKRQITLSSQWEIDRSIRRVSRAVSH